MTVPSLKGPDFLGVGMERAGTSWLFAQLASHPDIWVPPLKELHFFDVIDPQARYLKHRYKYHLPSRLKQKFAPLIHMDNRPEFYKNSYLTYLLWDFYFFTGKFNLDWYKHLFHKRFTKGKICGEITPAYSNLSMNTIQIILDMNHNMKFLMMIRNPKERLWSGVVHHFRHVEKKKFKDVSDADILAYLEQDVATNRSNLSAILHTWQGQVSKDNFLIHDFQDIQKSPEKIIESSYRFLGVDPSYLPPEELYVRKINSYTKQDFKPSLAVQEHINKICDPMMDALSKIYPDIVEGWS